MLLCRREGAVAWLVLHRPERHNALNLALGVALLEALDELHADPGVPAVVLTGAGRAFCAGDDLRGMVDPAKEAPVSGCCSDELPLLVGAGRR